MNDRARRAGYLAFFISGICAISASVIISLLQESRNLDYGMSGTLLSLMSIGNLAAGFLTGILPGKLGAKPTVLLLTAGYAVGYALMLPRGGAALLALAFVFPPKNARRAMVLMAVGCVVFYIALLMVRSQGAALLLLLGFSLSIAGLNPTIVSCAGKMTTAASMGIMLPAAGLGAILMPWLIGLVAQFAGLRIGMAVNVLSCVGMLVLAGVLAAGNK